MHTFSVRTLLSYYQKSLMSQLSFTHYHDLLTIYACLDSDDYVKITDSKGQVIRKACGIESFGVKVFDKEAIVHFDTNQYFVEKGFQAVYEAKTSSPLGTSSFYVITTIMSSFHAILYQIPW